MSRASALPLPRLAYLALAWAALGLGLLGVLLPLLPTTPFLLLALWAGSKGSTRFKWWLLRHRHFGPALRQWSRHGAIDPRAKALAIAVMTSSWLWLYLRGTATAVLVFLALLFGALAVFLATRPSPR